ncbi:MAG TPA: class I SAM-dependent methyltransferase [Mycobacteriales bacterium]|jgi:ubiquinone/menaquinone biosynthesis C-methylase UbiE|nr:class I SAM-dependent methyltransferase [Mycobacteriales bacterium]
MPAMSSVEQAFCRGAPWRAVAGRAVLPWALRGAAPRGRVLEVGAGSGAMAAGLLRRHPDLDLTASDYDPAMVAVAARALAAFGGRARATVADATALPFADESFDTVLSFLMLHHVGAWERAVAEAVRVLRPGGLLLGLDLVDTPPSRLVHRLDRSPFRLASRAALAAALAAAPTERTAVLPALGGTAMRFAARRR